MVVSLISVALKTLAFQYKTFDAANEVSACLVILVDRMSLDSPRSFALSLPIISSLKASMESCFRHNKNVIHKQFKVQRLFMMETDTFIMF
ncbi:hypothetical protein CEXT_666421 [Caerostris extrusa]|uniref:Protein kinase domain-containing protein n=1 Tax=Caerostris extrusa TaxID=172846 RepID=A0AAV4UTT6_CAEEX|nr:hypothetical protein CEXT_666421 [Caerostris extrusa]